MLADTLNITGMFYVSDITLTVMSQQELTVASLGLSICKLSVKYFSRTSMALTLTVTQKKSRILHVSGLNLARLRNLKLCRKSIYYFV